MYNYVYVYVYVYAYVPVMWTYGVGAGRRSAAQHQDCVFCGSCVKRGLTHVFGRCPHWDSHRLAFLGVVPDPPSDAWVITTAILGCPVSSPAFSEAVLFADAVDAAASRFWATRGVNS